MFGRSIPLRGLVKLREIGQHMEVSPLATWGAFAWIPTLSVLLFQISFSLFFLFFFKPSNFIRDNGENRFLFHIFHEIRPLTHLG